MRAFQLAAACVVVLAASVGQAAVMTYTSSGTFVVPGGVTSIDVLAIGGGSAGPGSHYTAGGGGYLSVGTFAVTPGYGAGGGASGYSAGQYGIGGSGADGLVVVQFSTAVPEPSTLALAAIGMIGFGGYARRRRKRSSTRYCAPTLSA